MSQGVYEHHLDVPAAAIDANGHANNVEFVRWMQDAAVAHARAVGSEAATVGAAATWVVLSHHVDYRRPAMLGDRITVLTWVSNFRRAFSLRKYKFVRDADQVVLALGETNWAFIDVGTGRPKSIPPELAAMFESVPEDREP